MFTPVVLADPLDVLCVYPDMKRLALVVCLLLGAAADAHAWSPGPYSFDRCAKTFKMAVRGTVIDVHQVARRPGGWVLSHATINVRRSWGLKARPKQVGVFFWSSTDNTLTLAHSIRKRERVLVFLSRDLKPVRGMLNARKHAAGFFLRFAKANHRGYLFKIVSSGRARLVRDAFFKTNQLPLPQAEARLRTM